MSQSCQCCGGIHVLTPESEVNRPGLGAIVFRVGTHATFLESMLARLSSLSLDVPSALNPSVPQRIYPLRELTTRDPSDFSIALLDSWALLADVLTFYQERIANEGYLETALERRSILELGRLVGYKLRPGVSASVYLAFTASDGFSGTVPAGTRAQSIPGTGERPQFFETSLDLVARDTWNALKPRRTRPQLITQQADPGTDAETRDTLYFKGILTNLKVGDPLLIVLGELEGQRVLRFIDALDPDSSANRTEVVLRPPPPLHVSGTTSYQVAKAALAPFMAEAQSIFVGNDLAQSVLSLLSDLLNRINHLPVNTSIDAVSSMLTALLPRLQESLAVAEARDFTRLEAWLKHLMAALKALAQQVDDGELDGIGQGQADLAAPVQPVLSASPLANLADIADHLALAPSLQPANSQRLNRSVAQAFAPQADTAPRLLATLKPPAAAGLYGAWSGISTPASQVQVYALRVRAAAYGHNAPKRSLLPEGPKKPVKYEEWTIEASDAGSVLSLDSVYDKVLPGSLAVVINDDRKAPLIRPILDVTLASRSNYGMAARVTQITLDEAWLPDVTAKFPSLRKTTVYARSEQLELAEEPLDNDVEGSTLELAGLYDGLESGRWVIVSGERTDIPHTTGVMASELVMVAGVTQGSRAPLCALFPQGYVPFDKIYYTTAAAPNGDRLVVGEVGNLDELRQLLPTPTIANQKFCDQIELAPGFFVNAYVPTKLELDGGFPDFDGLLVEPTSQAPYPGGTIPVAKSEAPQVFAWRISAQPVHTILTLANALSYKYDSASVTIYGNVVKATHGQTVGEVLGDGDGSRGFQRFTLGQSPLTYLPAPTAAGAESTLTTRVNDLTWHETDTLSTLGPRDRSYITDADDNDLISLVFGNGEHGARLPTGSSNVKATYRYGIGASGNVTSGQISQLASQPLGLKGVLNPLRASGGADRDRAQDGRQNAPLAVAALDRLVSVQDYADFARAYAGIGKAVSARLSDGRRLVVHVSIAGASDIPIDPSSDLYQNLLLALQAQGDPHQPIELAVRRLKLLVLSARVKLLPDYLWEALEPQLRDQLLTTFGFDQRDLGQPAFLSEAVAALQAVAGVSYVDVQIFDAVPEDATASELASLANTLSRKDAVQSELAFVDPNEPDPSRRIRAAELVILTPLIPDTVILVPLS